MNGECLFEIQFSPLVNLIRIMINMQCFNKSIYLYNIACKQLITLWSSVAHNYTDNRIVVWIRKYWHCTE